MKDFSAIFLSILLIWGIIPAPRKRSKNIMPLAKRGVISGNIVPCSSCSVVISTIHSLTGAKLTALPNAHGVFRFNNLQPGDYLISVEIPEGLCLAPIAPVCLNENETVDIGLLEYEFNLQGNKVVKD